MSLVAGAAGCWLKGIRQRQRWMWAELLLVIDRQLPRLLSLPHMHLQAAPPAGRHRKCLLKGRVSVSPECSWMLLCCQAAILEQTRYTRGKRNQWGLQEDQFRCYAGLRLAPLSPARPCPNQFLVSFQAWLMYFRETSSLNRSGAHNSSVCSEEMANRHQRLNPGTSISWSSSSRDETEASHRRQLLPPTNKSHCSGLKMTKTKKTFYYLLSSESSVFQLQTLLLLLEHPRLDLQMIQVAVMTPQTCQSLVPEAVPELWLYGTSRGRITHTFNFIYKCLLNRKSDGAFHDPWANIKY